MRKIERNAAGKYARRIERERAREILRELFDFFTRGVPQDWKPIAKSKVRVVQKAFKEILRSSLDNQKPREADLAVWIGCLNISEKIEPYYFGKFIRGSEKTPVLRYAVVTPSYFKRAADLLKRFLTEFRNELLITGSESLLALCPIRSCGSLFLKSKANQTCCSRACGNRYDYQRRTSTEEGKERHRKKSSDTYYRIGKKRKSAGTSGTK